MPNTKSLPHANPLIQEDSQDTLLHVSAVITCLQHVDLKTGLEDEGELGMNLILETIRGAIHYEAIERVHQ